MAKTSTAAAGTGGTTPTPTPTPTPSPATLVAKLHSEEETIATHATAFLAAAGGAIALVHPGFQVPTVVEEIVTPVSWAIAGGLEVWNLVTKRSLKKAIVGLFARS